MKVEVRYTINRDGTVEKWYLEKETAEGVYLRKSMRPVWHDIIKCFLPDEVYPAYQAARRASKARKGAEE